MACEFVCGQALYFDHCPLNRSALSRFALLLNRVRDESVFFGTGHAVHGRAGHGAPGFVLWQLLRRCSITRRARFNWQPLELVISGVRAGPAWNDGLPNKREGQHPMKDDTAHAHPASHAEPAVGGAAAAGDSTADANDPFETLSVAADILQQAASQAVTVLGEVVPVAMLCIAVQRHSVELSLLPETVLQDAHVADAMAEPLNRTAQQGLSAMRTMCDRQRVLMGHIEQAGVLLMTLAEQLQRREAAIGLERARHAQQLQANAEVARDMAKHAMNIDRIMSSVWSQTQEVS